MSDRAMQHGQFSRIRVVGDRADVKGLPTGVEQVIGGCWRFPQRDAIDKEFEVIGGSGATPILADAHAVIRIEYLEDKRSTYVGLAGNLPTNSPHIYGVEGFY
jgi:hypothetical protein